MNLFSSCPETRLGEILADRTPVRRQAARNVYSVEYESTDVVECAQDGSPGALALTLMGSNLNSRMGRRPRFGATIR